MRLITEEVKDEVFALKAKFKIRFINQQQPRVLDPSELLRPEPDFTEKGVSKFRDYTIDLNDPLKEMVRKTYRNMHLNQTVDFVRSKLVIKFEFNLLKLFCDKIRWIILLSK